MVTTAAAGAAWPPSFRVMSDSSSPAAENEATALLWQMRERAEVSCHLLEGA